MRRPAARCGTDSSRTGTPGRPLVCAPISATRCCPHCKRGNECRAAAPLTAAFSPCAGTYFPATSMTPGQTGRIHDRIALKTLVNRKKVRFLHISSDGIFLALPEDRQCIRSFRPPYPTRGTAFSEIAFPPHPSENPKARRSFWALVSPRRERILHITVYR